MYRFCYYLLGNAFDQEKKTIGKCSVRNKRSVVNGDAGRPLESRRPA